MRHILKCVKCGNYTMEEKCPKCGSSATNPKPAKYSPEDKYGDYRRKAKKEQLVKEGLL
jgi:H/ACA ribonucleoprotein complex subunit 3